MKMNIILDFILFFFLMKEAVLRILLEFIKPNSEYDVFLAHKVNEIQNRILIASAYCLIA